MTRFKSPRSARETWRASTSSRAPVAPIRRRNVPTRSPFFQVTTPRPRRIRHEAGRPTVPSQLASRWASSAATRNSRWVRPPDRLSEPWARKRPRNQASRQWSGDASQSNLVIPSAGRASAAANAGGPSTSVPPTVARSLASRISKRASGASRAAPTSASASASDRRSHARDGSIAASSDLSARTRSRSLPLIRSDRRHGPVTQSGATWRGGGPLPRDRGSA